MKKVTELLSNIPLITGLLIALSIVKYIIFYKLFYIPITQYLQASEILLLFTEDIIYIFLFLLVPRLVGYFEDLVNDEKETSRIINVKDHQQSWKNYVKQFNQKRNLVLTTLCIVLIGIIVLAFLGDRFDQIQAFYGSICIIALIFCIFWERSLLKQNIRHELRQYLYFFMLFIIILFFVCVRTVSEAQRVYNGEFLGTTITTKDSTYISDSAHFYIGRTSQYTYIYNKPHKSSTVLPNSEIERIILKTKYAR